jgi:hypothetical protein
MARRRDAAAKPGSVAMEPPPPAQSRRSCRGVAVFSVILSGCGLVRCPQVVEVVAPLRGAAAAVAAAVRRRAVEPAAGAARSACALPARALCTWTTSRIRRTSACDAATRVSRMIPQYAAADPSRLSRLSLSLSTCHLCVLTSAVCGVRLLSWCAAALSPLVAVLSCGSAVCRARARIYTPGILYLLVTVVGVFLVSLYSTRRLITGVLSVCGEVCLS